MKVTKHQSLLRIVYFLFLPILFTGCSNNQNNSDFLEAPQFNDSLEAYNFYVKNYPENKEPVFQRAKFFIRQGNIKRANLDLHKALDLDSTDLRFRTTYASVQLAQLNLEEVKFHYEYTLKAEPHNIEALMGMAKLYALISNFPIAQHNYIDTVISINPHYAEAYFL